MRILRYTPQGHPRHSGKVVIETHDQERSLRSALARMWVLGDDVSVKTEERPALMRKSVEKHRRRRVFGGNGMQD